MKARFVSLFVVVGAVAAAGVAESSKWDLLQHLLEQGVSSHVFPGAVAAIFDADKVLWTGAAGDFTYGTPPPMTPTYVPPMTVNVSPTHQYTSSSSSSSFVTTTSTLHCTDIV